MPRTRSQSNSNVARSTDRKSLKEEKKKKENGVKEKKNVKRIASKEKQQKHAKKLKIKRVEENEDSDLPHLNDDEGGSPKSKNPTKSLILENLSTGSNLMSQYEKERLENIKRNQEMMVTLYYSLTTSAKPRINFFFGRNL